MAARMGPLVLPRTPYAVSSARNNFKIDRYLNFSTGQISDRYSGGVMLDSAKIGSHCPSYTTVRRPAGAMNNHFLICMLFTFASSMCCNA